MNRTHKPRVLLANDHPALPADTARLLRQEDEAIGAAVWDDADLPREALDMIPTCL